MAFRKQPVQPASTPASNRNTPWTTSSCSLWKGHTEQGGKWICAQEKANSLISTSLFYDPIFKTWLCSFLVARLLGCQVRFINSPSGWSLWSQVLWAFLPRRGFGSSYHRHGNRKETGNSGFIHAFVPDLYQATNWRVTSRQMSRDCFCIIPQLTESHRWARWMKCYSKPLCSGEFRTELYLSMNLKLEGEKTFSSNC